MHPHRIHEQNFVGFTLRTEHSSAPFPLQPGPPSDLPFDLPLPLFILHHQGFLWENQQKQQSSLPAVGVWKVCSPYHCSLCPSALSGGPLLLPPPTVVAVSSPHGPPWPSLQHSLLHSQFATWAPSPRPDWELLESKAVCVSFPSTASSVAGAR